MTKEELKQEAEEYFKSICGDYNEEYERTGKRHYWVGFDIKNAYLASAEPREKRIAELEKACEETQELLDKQIEATYKLDKENAELKDYRLTTLAQQQTDMSKYALNLEHKLSWYDDQLTKAKELLERFLGLGNLWDLDCKDYFPLRKEAEQFLNSEVEK